MRKLGIRYQIGQGDGKGPGLPAYAAAAVFDIESGEICDNVERIEMTYDVAGAIMAKVTFYPAAIDAREQVYPK